MNHVTTFPQRQRQIILSTASLGVILAIVGCDPAKSLREKSDPRSAKTLGADSTAPVEQRVRTILVEQLGLKTEPKLTDRFVEDLGADSLDCVELLMALEEEFNLEIPDETAVNLKTLRDTIAFINQPRKQ